jgi:hypothetical protein
MARTTKRAGSEKAHNTFWQDFQQGGHLRESFKYWRTHVPEARVDRRDKTQDRDHRHRSRPEPVAPAYVNPVQYFRVTVDTGNLAARDVVVHSQGIVSPMT